MGNRVEHICGQVKVIQHDDYKWGVEDLQGNVIVKYGKYNWIDKFWKGLSRVNKNDKWGVINMEGEEVIPLVYENIWKFYDKPYDAMVVEVGGLGNQAKLFAILAADKLPDKPQRFKIPFDDLSTLIPFDVSSKYDNAFEAEQNADGTWNLNRKENIDEVGDAIKKRYWNDDEYEDYDEYGSHYGEFAGSYAQDVMGYSDDVINDAFEGDPDNYWNID